MLTVLALALFGGDVHALGSDSFEARQRASDRLMAHSWLAWRACDFPFRDLERRRRADRVMRSAIPRGLYPPIAAPWALSIHIDAFGTESLLLPVVCEGCPYSSSVCVPAAPFREATAVLAEAATRTGLPPATVRAVVAKLQAAEDGKR